MTFNQVKTLVLLLLYSILLKKLNVLSVSLTKRQLEVVGSVFHQLNLEKVVVEDVENKLKKPTE